MFETANKSKVNNTFLNNKALRGLTGFKSLKFLDGHNHVDIVHVKAKISSSYARCPECNKKTIPCIQPMNATCWICPFMENDCR